MAISRHQSTLFTTTRAAPLGMALLALACLPWWAACDESLVAAALPTQITGADPALQADNLTKATLADVDTDVRQLEQPQALDNPPAQPPPCAQPLRQITLQCVEQTRTIATACVGEIAQFFQQDQPEAAHAAAQACIEQINQHTAGCLQTLRDQCRDCLTELLNQNAPMEPIEALLGACRRAARHILHARRGAVGAIQDAVDRGVAQRCIAEIHQQAVGCADQNAQTAADCVVEIETLLAAGQVEQAVAAAEACIQQIRATTADCAHVIQAICQECLQRLVRNCGEGMIVARLREACEATLDFLLRSARQAVGQIHNALPPPPDPEGS